MAKDSAPKNQEPKSLDESKKEDSSFPDKEVYEEYLEVDPNDLEEVDPKELEGIDIDNADGLYEVVEEEYEGEPADGPGGEGESAAEKEEPESESSKGEEEKWKSLLSSSSDEEGEDSEDSEDSESDDAGEGEGRGEGEDKGQDDLDEGIPFSERFFTDSPEVNIRLLNKTVENAERTPFGVRKTPTNAELEAMMVYEKDEFDFPVDPERWREEDLREFWEDAPYEMTKPGWDPVWADDEDWEVVKRMEEEGEDPPIAPFYVPYRRSYPVIPTNHPDIYSPKTVIEELDRIEEFLKWASYIFPDGSS